jgi:hypothetical protein
MKYVRKRAGHTCTDCTLNTDITTELNVTPFLDKIQHYKRNWTRHLKRMPRKRLPRINKKKYTKRQKKTVKTTEEISG